MFFYANKINIVFIQVAAVVAVVAAVYMRIFLKETSRQTDALEQPILKPMAETTESGNEQLKAADLIKKIPLPKDIIRLLKSR